MFPTLSLTHKHPICPVSDELLILTLGSASAPISLVAFEIPSLHSTVGLASVPHYSAFVSNFMNFLTHLLLQMSFTTTVCCTDFGMSRLHSGISVGSRGLGPSHRGPRTGRATGTCHAFPALMGVLRVSSFGSETKLYWFLTRTFAFLFLYCRALFQAQG